MNADELLLALGDMPGLLTREQAPILYNLVNGLADDAVVLEIGAFKGYSTCALAYACKDTRRHVWTIDTFVGNLANTNYQDGENYRAEFDQNVADRGLTELVTVLAGKSEEFYATWDKAIDLLFIDGNHWIMAQDLEAFLPHLRQDGWLVMHDVIPADDGGPSPLCGFADRVGEQHFYLNMMWARKL